ncbi:MAG TPA: HlyD family secretion protein, partial [Cellvibrio sp.]|nr:HlyD family secretion protein [Cellvibrio sp.]
MTDQQNKEDVNLATTIVPDASDRLENATAPVEDAPRTVKKGGLIIVIIILLSLLWYLVGDRYTPYTTQARIDGYVVGVAPEVSGIVTKVWVKNDQRVKAGQPLFDIAQSQYQIALDKARSDLDNAVRQVGAGSAAVDAARANLVAARANETKARQDATRLERLYKEDPGTISVRLLEVARATFDQAKAQVVAAEADIQRAIETMGGDDAVNNTILATARTAVAKAELDFSHTQIKASNNGVVTDLRTDVGIFAAAGKPVLTLVGLQDIWISAEYTENNLGHLKLGTPVEILFDVLPGQVFKGQIRSIGLGISASQDPAAGTLPSIQNNRDWLRQSQRFPITVSFDNKQDPMLEQQLRIGGQASVIAYSEDSFITKLLGKIWIRIASYLSYA